MKQPLSTYRVQLHAGFTLRDLRERLPYLRALGIDWVYASPVLRAVPGSTHGYDVADVAELNPELGTDDDWRELHALRRDLGMGWLQDIVPNHMAYDLANPWVRELLRHGEASTVARHFDIDWRHPDYRGKVMLPILGAPLEQVIAEGHIRVDREAETLHVYERRLPLSARSLSKLPAGGEPDVAAVVARQHYALAYWRETESRINFRRFFTVNGLICLRQERPETFRATHALMLEWIAAGEVDGLRLDHVDGLLDPTGYLRRLREAVGEDVYIVAEKILEHGERLPADWPLQGTTGYDFLAFQNQLLRHGGAATERLAEVAAGFGERPTPIAEDVARNKRWVLTERMAGELDNVVHHARGALAGLPLGMDHDLLRGTVADWLSAFPVYRAYPRYGNLPEGDRRVLVDAVDRALAAPTEHRRGLEALRSWLRSITRVDDKTAAFLQRAMQLSGPLMAKGIEDTTFYQRFGYLACNEVGDSPAPERLLTPGEFHDRMVERAATDLNATSTHDTKRAEDARARLHAAGARPGAWAAFAQTADAYAAPHAEGLPRPVLYLLLQTIASGWRYGDDPRAEDFLPRVRAFAEKALRESKVYSNWATPDEELEARAAATLTGLLTDEGFRGAAVAYLDAVAPQAWLNTLRSVVLKATVPGAPDVYQGTEYLDYSLVDPDNRRPVDYAARAASLDAADAAWSAPSDAAKQLVLHRLLQARASWPDLWRRGTYVPVAVAGGPAGEVLAFRRIHGDDSALVVLAVRTDGAVDWPRGGYFAGASVRLPDLGRQREVLSGARRELAGEVAVGDLLREGPAAVYIPAR